MFIYILFIAAISEYFNIFMIFIIRFVNIFSTVIIFLFSIVKFQRVDFFINNAILIL
jgi:hypothetical protein